MGEGAGVLLLAVVGVITLESSTVGGLKAYDGLNNSLAGLALSFYQHALGVAGGGLRDELKMAVAVEVWRVDRFVGEGVGREACRVSLGEKQCVEPCR